MSGLNMMGAYSGIDMSVIDQLMEAEAARGVRFTQQREEYTQSQNAWKDLNTRLDSLYNRLEDLKNVDTFESKTVDLTGPENLSVSADSDAATGNYRLEVQQLATQSRLTGERIDVESIYEELKFSGSLELSSGEGDPITISIEESDSLRDISDKINEQTSESSIQSSIVDNRLILTHTEYGEHTINVAGDAADSLNLNGIEAETGEQARFTVDGLSVVRDSNTIDDVIEGLSFTLNNVHADNESTVVSVSEDMDKAAETLEKFVEQYNSTQNYITSQLDVGDPTAENNETGALSGDGTIMRLQSSLRNMMTRDSSSDSSVNALSDLGIEVDRYGTATFDRAVLEEQILENPDDVKSFFSRTEEVTETVINEDNEEVTETRNEQVGFAEDMRSLVNEYISSSSGIIKTRNETYDRMISDVNDRIEQFEDRLDVKRDRYIRQFTALDQAMMQAESQMEFMFSQLGMEG